MSRRLLILGGTAEARAVAERLAERLAGPGGGRVILSLAGVTRAPVLPAGVAVRRGGFGGAEGLAAFLRAESVTDLIDATHPFAARISAHAVAAARAVGVPLIRLERPPWLPEPGDRWREVADLEAAVDALPATARRVFLAIGRQSAAAFARRPEIHYLLRQIDPPAGPPPLPRCTVLSGRPPADPAAEDALLRRHGIELLVVKNSGGPARAKLAAARALGLPVILVARPALPAAATAPDPAGILAWATLGGDHSGEQRSRPDAED